MKVKVSVDMSEFCEAFNSDTLDVMVADELKAQIMMIVKRDPKYKAFINKKADEMLGGLKL